MLRAAEERAAAAIQIATARWTGQRRETFVRAAAGVGVLLQAQAVAAAELAEICEEYAALVRRTAEEVDDCARRYRAEQEAAAWAREQRDRLVAMGDPTLTRGLEADHEDDARAAERRAELHLDTAHEAHRRLERGASQIADAIDAVTARAPDVAILSGGGLGMRLSGLSRLAAPSNPVLDALLLAVAAGSIVPPPPVPALGTDPGEVAGWWHLLSPEEQARLLATQPRALGNLDGLPARVRDRANRNCLAGYRKELSATLAHAVGEEAERLAAKLKGLDKVEEVLRRGHRQLLLLDPFSGQQLHAAVAVGDVDSAAHIAVFVPGFRSNVQRTFTGYDDDIAKLQARAQELSRKHGDHRPVATITWQGYDAPQLEQAASINERSVVNPHLAQVGGVGLAAFFTGLNAAHAEDPHITGLAHSYGSLVAGYALRHGQTGLDDVALLGNPGTSVGDRSDLHVPKGHLYAAEAVDDWVPDLDVLAPFGDSVRHLDDVTYLNTGPASIDLDHTQGILGHGSYLKEGSTNQRNLAVITAGIDRSQLIRGAAPPGTSGEIVRKAVNVVTDVGRDVAPVVRPRFLRW